MSSIKEPWEIGLMRGSGRRLAEVVARLREIVAVGMTTDDLDRLAEEKIRGMGAVPSFKGYRVGRNVYPKTICTSVNEQVVHGIPNGRPLLAGDIVSIDVGLIYGGYHADRAFTVVLGDDPPAAVRHLLDVTEKSLYLGVAQALPGNRIGDIGHAVQSFVEPHGFGIVREYVGHGIGRLMHETPSVPNFGKAGRGLLLKSGMCLAVEPMVTMGHYETKTLADGWTVVTRDGSQAAHFEHTIAITPKGPEVLTVLEGENPLAA
jgi:methionyl aminopeptidase